MGVSLRALLLFSFLCFWTKESGAETKFVQRGGNVLLQLKEPITLKDDETFSWRVKGSTNIVRLIQNRVPSINKILKERVEFSPHNLSLLIKNLTFADSQFYTAVISEDVERVILNYTIKVQDAVSPVVLNVSFVSLGGDSCHNLHTATCSAASSVINSTFRCIGQTCKNEGEEPSKHTPSDSTLRIYLLSDSIITCNHSNQVSWTNETKEIQHDCAFKLGHHSNTVAIKVVACVVVILVFGTIGSVVYRKKRASGSRKIMSSTNTEYETPQEICPTRTPIRNDAEDQLASPFSIYCMAGHPNPPDVLPVNPTRDEAETVYAQVKKPNRVTEIEMNHQNSQSVTEMAT